MIFRSRLTFEFQSSFRQNVAKLSNVLENSIKFLNGSWPDQNGLKDYLAVRNNELSKKSKALLLPSNSIKKCGEKRDLHIVISIWHSLIEAWYMVVSQNV